MDDAQARAAIEAHFVTASDPDRVHISSEIYSEDAVLEFPQGGERIRGKANMDRTTGSGDLWVNEYVIRYDGVKPTYIVGIMEFRGGMVFRERLYFGDPWDPPAWRAQWVEPLAR
jgi:hypothetical protein